MTSALVVVVRNLRSVAELKISRPYYLGKHKKRLPKGSRFF